MYWKNFTIRPHLTPQTCQEKNYCQYIGRLNFEVYPPCSLARYSITIDWPHVSSLLYQFCEFIALHKWGEYDSISPFSVASITTGGELDFDRKNWSFDFLNNEESSTEYQSSTCSEYCIFKCISETGFRAMAFTFFIATDINIRHNGFIKYKQVLSFHYLRLYKFLHYFLRFIAECAHPTFSRIYLWVAFLHQIVGEQLWKTR